MKVVILCGGFGSRISEESQFRPKPMIGIGGRPILWHIMKYYSSWGYNEFIICASYKQEYIKEYFADYFRRSTDVTFDYTGNQETVEYHSTHVEPWRVTIADTGLATLTAGRVRRIRKYVQDEPFMLTYGDGLSDVNLDALRAYHETHGAVVTLTAVNVAQKFGVLDMDADGRVESFREKSDADDSAINGGFMICEPSLFDEPLADDDDLASATLEALASRGQLAAYRHFGFWQSMDTQRDRELLLRIWESGQAPWKRWDESALQ